MTTILALILAVLMAGSGAAAGTTDTAYEVELKAAFLYNFAKFTDWPGLPDGAPIVVCTLSDDAVASALATITRGQTIGTRPLEIKTITSTNGQACHELFISTRVADIGRVLSTLNGRPTLTVSDARGFAGSGGMIELFVERDRMRFSVDVEAVQRSTVKLSSRLLSLATIVRGDHGK